MLFDLTELRKCTNEIFWPQYFIKDRYLINYGGAGSGKSHFIAQKYLVRIIIGIKKKIAHKILVLRKTQPAARKSVFALFRYYNALWGLDSVCNTNKSDMTLNYDGGSEILFGGFDDPEKIKSIEGLTSIWAEEATEFSRSDFRQMDLRIRGNLPTYPQICISFNPIECEWLQKEFFEYGPDTKDISKKAERYKRFEKTIKVGSKIIKLNGTMLLTTYKDNKFLDEQYKAVLEGLKEQDESYYQIYTLGLWGRPKGIIYIEGKNWDIVAPEMPKQYDDVIWGLDFGYSGNPAALVEIRLSGNETYEREHIYETGLTNPALIKRLKQIITNRNQMLVADSAEPKSIQEIRNAGFNIHPSNKGPDSVRHGINTVKTMRTHILSDSPNLIKEKRIYKWKMDKDENPLPEPVKFKDHLIDAERYAIQKVKGKVKAGLVLVGEKEEKEIDPILDDDLWSEI